MHKNFLKIAFFCFLAAAAAGCASAKPFNGVNAQGEKVYLGPVPIENTQPYKEYAATQHTEVDKQKYLFRRLKDATKLEFYHDGSWYNSVQAYRGGIWLMRERYQKGQETRAFIKKYVERSETTNQLHLVRYPDGTLQIGAAILYNELDLLEQTSAKSGKA